MKKILTVLVIVFSIMSFCGCSNDDEPNPGIKELYGYWYRYIGEFTDKVSYEHMQNIRKYYQTLTFTSGQLAIVNDDISYDEFLAGVKSIYRCTYTLKGDQLTVTNMENGISETCKIIIDGTNLIIGDKIYSREKVK